ncbi:MAG: DUF3352 domain-containing protein [Anaerolineae bacterium]|nr:DUF3352 domain-containing protein [Anaerolineae bacterium]
MKKFLFVLVLLLLSVQGLFAQTEVNAFEAAQYFPSETAFFAAVRLDDPYIDQLDGVINFVATGLNDFGVPNLTIRQALQMSGFPFDTDTLLAVLGDYAAVGITLLEDNNPDPNLTYFVIQLADPEGARQLLRENLPMAEETDTGFVLGEAAFNLTDDLLIISDSSANLTTLPTDTLANDPDFQNALGKLPAPGYNVGAYVNLNRLPQVPNELGALLTAYSAAGNAIFGLTILDNRTYVIDQAVIGAETSPMTATAIDPDFARLIPSDADLYVQATDFTALYNTLFTEIERLQSLQAEIDGTTPPNQPDPREQIEAGLAMAGIDLEQDILSWTTGEYAAFTRLDTAAIVADLLENPNRIDLNGRFDFGLLIEATNAQAAQNFSGKIGLLLQQAAQSNPQPDVTVSSETIEGLTVTQVSVQAPLGTDQTPLNLDVVIGANEDVFFIATLDAVTTLLTGGESLADTSEYQSALTYALPNPTTFWYTTGEGLITLAAGNVLTLALTGPAIDNVFDEIVDDLAQPGSTPMPRPTPMPTAAPNVEENAQIVEALNYFVDNLEHSTISTAIDDDGTFLLRLSLSLRAR